VRVAQTIREVGLETGATAIWAEPRRGQGLKPRFGSRPFPRKPLYAVLIISGLVALIALLKRSPISTWQIAFVSLLAVGIAWPIAILLDRLNRRNVWVYNDRILITHANARVVVLKSDINSVVVYRVSLPSLVAVEFVSLSGKSNVVALPQEIAVADLISKLQTAGYVVRNEL
jgi:hypothetical protein